MKGFDVRHSVEFHHEATQESPWIWGKVTRKCMYISEKLASLALFDSVISPDEKTSMVAVMKMPTKKTPEARIKLLKQLKG